MTLKALLNSDAATLEAMSSKELEDFFAPYLDVTRPERAAKLGDVKTRVSKSQSQASILDDKIARAARIAESMGQIGLEDILEDL